MKKPAVLLAIIFAAVFLFFMFRSAFQAGRYRCEVCMEFEGRRDCRTASAENRDHAIRTAIDNACAHIASGVTDTSRCTQTRPALVRCTE